FHLSIIKDLSRSSSDRTLYRYYANFSVNSSRSSLSYNLFYLFKSECCSLFGKRNKIEIAQRLDTIAGIVIYMAFALNNNSGSMLAESSNSKMIGKRPGRHKNGLLFSK